MENDGWDSGFFSIPMHQQHFHRERGQPENQTTDLYLEDNNVIY